MSNAPTTFRGERPEDGGVDWNHAASLHKRGDEGMLAAFRMIRQGTLADLVYFVSELPEEQRREYEIVKEGDRRLGLGEIMALAGRPDFPRGAG